MGRKDLIAKRTELRAAGQQESLEARVLAAFFGHPSMVGSPSAGGSRRLDLSRADDRKMFLGAVQRSFDLLLTRLDFREKPKAEEHYKTFVTVLFS